MPTSPTVGPAGTGALLLALLTDFVAISILAGDLYRRRRTRMDLMFAFVALNVGVLAVTIVLLHSDAGIGLGLFGILSIIRLRSDQISQSEIAHYFVALALGLLAGLTTTPAWLGPVLSAVLVVVAYAADHRGRRALPAGPAGLGRDAGGAAMTSRDAAVLAGVATGLAPVDLDAVLRAAELQARTDTKYLVPVSVFPTLVADLRAVHADGGWRCSRSETDDCSATSRSILTRPTSAVTTRIGKAAGTATRCAAAPTPTVARVRWR